MPASTTTLSASPPALVKPGLAYRIGVKFDKRLSTLAQLREAAKRLNTYGSVVVEFSPYKASLLVVFPKTTKNLAGIQYGATWFKIGGSAAIIDTIRPEVGYR
ncbi:MAG TPA: hypothetical protein VGK73_13080 [Polyangiaceae bacterium]